MNVLQSTVREGIKRPSMKFILPIIMATMSGCSFHTGSEEDCKDMAEKGLNGSNWSSQAPNGAILTQCNKLGMKFSEESAEECLAYVNNRTDFSCPVEFQDKYRALLSVLNN